MFMSIGSPRASIVTLPTSSAGTATNAATTAATAAATATPTSEGNDAPLPSSLPSPLPPLPPPPPQPSSHAHHPHPHSYPHHRSHSHATSNLASPSNSNATTIGSSFLRALYTPRASTRTVVAPPSLPPPPPSSSSSSLPASSLSATSSPAPAPPRTLHQPAAAGAATPPIAALEPAYQRAARRAAYPFTAATAIHQVPFEIADQLFIAPFVPLPEPADVLPPPSTQSIAVLPTSSPALIPTPNPSSTPSTPSAHVATLLPRPAAPAASTQAQPWLSPLSSLSSSLSWSSRSTPLTPATSSIAIPHAHAHAHAHARAHASSSSSSSSSSPTHPSLPSPPPHAHVQSLPQPHDRIIIDRNRDHRHHHVHDHDDAAVDATADASPPDSPLYSPVSPLDHADEWYSDDTLTRGREWLAWLDPSRLSARFHHALYTKLRRSATPHSKPIQKDVVRTFPTHALFHHDKIKSMLSSILSAYSLYDVEIGYSQGMAFVAGVLLAHIANEEHCFWSFVTVMFSPRHSLRALYTDDCRGLRVCLSALHHWVQLHPPLLALSTHLQRENVDVALFATQWFVTVYSYRFDFAVVQSIWDRFVARGLCVLLQIAIAILRHFNDHLLQSRFETLVPFLSELANVPSSICEVADTLVVPAIVIDELDQVSA